MTDERFLEIQTLNLIVQYKGHCVGSDEINFLCCQHCPLDKEIPDKCLNEDDRDTFKRAKRFFNKVPDEEILEYRLRIL
ncbi:MAG TPA: hypothetical protein P5136_01535 [Methanofastidiosum sp.]|nr:hypothetical protein [Methanofastidiosum sp.]